MHKVGDKFEVVAARMQDDLVAVGDIVTLASCKFMCGGHFRTKDNKEFVAEFEGEGTGVSRVVRPYRTEAEKRGAKFGVGGVVKETGERIIFYYTVRGLWGVIKEGDREVCQYHQHEIRLDHEPEYKEIPFSEATHEQRMDVGNLRGLADSEIDEIHVFQNGSYGFTKSGDSRIWQDTNYLTVRIPA